MGLGNTRSWKYRNNMIYGIHYDLIKCKCLYEMNVHSEVYAAYELVLAGTNTGHGKMDLAYAARFADYLFGNVCPYLRRFLSEDVWRAHYNGDYIWL